MERCDICGAEHAPWEPGGPLMVPKTDRAEGVRIVRAHVMVIVRGAGRNGITSRECARLLGIDWTDADADEVMVARDYVEA